MDAPSNYSRRHSGIMCKIRGGRPAGRPTLRLVLTYRHGIYSLLCFDIIFIGSVAGNTVCCFIINEFCFGKKNCVVREQKTTEK